MSTELINYCKKCQQPISHDTMRLNSDGKTIICPDCYEGKRDSSKPKIEPYNALDTLGIEPVESDEAENKPDAVQEMAEYIVFQCTGCSYKFSRKKSFKFNMLCPFCGKQSVEKYENKLSANKLLKESEGIDEPKPL